MVTFLDLIIVNHIDTVKYDSGSRSTSLLSVKFLNSSYYTQNSLPCLPN